MFKKIFIRYGHEILTNGYSSGASGLLDEYKTVREYGKELANLFRQNGYTVKEYSPLERKHKTTNQGLEEGVNEANKWGADLFLSVHLNAYDTIAHGTEVLYYPSSTKGKELATKLSSELSSKLNTRNRGAKPKNFYEVRKTSMPAVIIEPLFCDNKSDCGKYNKTTLAQAIYKGVTGKDAITQTFPCKGIVTGRVNARCQPTTTNSTIIGKLQRGTTVTLLEHKGDWYKVTHNDFTFWSSSKYINIQK